MALDGIDIASWQEGLVPSKMATTDFVIVKATGGTGYENPCFRRHADQTLAATKLLGCYHFAQERGCAGSAAAEADFFIGKFEPYKGRAVPFLDWEADALALDPAWAKAWCDRVYAKTGAKPGIYMSKSTCNARDWSALAKAGYPLWVAQYPDYSETGYQDDPWTDASPFGAWGKPELFQYTSSGCIPGYPGHLDLDLYYGDRGSWLGRCETGGAIGRAAAAVKAATAGAGAKQVAVSCANVAATIMQRMCEDDGFGYSWDERYGTAADKVKWTIEGRAYTIDRGDYDCSSAVITAWKMALQGTEYEGALDGATYTGNMRSVFLKSGLFEMWDTATTEARRGDVYLNDVYHTAMCLDGGRDNVLGYDALGEFCINEKGGVHGGKRGDQTGREAYVHAYYNYPWTCTLHYNGKADTVATAASPAQKGKTSAATGRAKLGVDGDWGPLTTRELQRQLGVTASGALDAATYRALQKKLGVAADGVFGPVTKKALQRKLGVEADGSIGPKTVKALQKALNAGKVAKW